MSQNSELVPKRRFKEFENAGDWEQRKLSSMTMYKNGKSHEDKQSTSGKYELINLNSISISGGLKHSGKFIEDTDDTLQKDDLVMILSDVGHGDLLGRVALIPNDNMFVLNQRVALLRPNETADPHFLFSYINAHQYYFKSQGAGMSQLNVSKGSVENFTSNVPTIQEQNYIGSFLKQINNIIALHQRKLDKLNNIKQSYLYQMFPQNGEKVPSLRFSEFSEEWKSNSMGELGKTYTGLNGKTKDDFGHGKAKFVTYMNVYKNTISNPNLVEEVELDSRQNEVKYGDVLFTTSSETPEEVGLSSVWLNNSENVYLNSFCFGYRPSINIDSYYLAYMLRSQSIRKKIILLAQGISRYNISKSKMMDIEIVFPKLEEQKKIGQFFKRLDENIDIQEQELEKLKNLKKAYLNEMFV